MNMPPLKAGQERPKLGTKLICANPNCGKQFTVKRNWPPPRYCKPKCQNNTTFREWYDRNKRKKHIV